jgi:hypothetical protein
MAEANNSPFLGKKSRNRPELKCITDRRYLVNEGFEESPVKVSEGKMGWAEVYAQYNVVYKKPQEAHKAVTNNNRAEIPEENGARGSIMDQRGKYKTRRKFQRFSVSIDSNPRTFDNNKRKVETKKGKGNKKIHHMKKNMLDLKKGIFSNKQSASKEKLKKKVELEENWNRRLRSLSAVHINVSRKIPFEICTTHESKQQLHTKPHEEEESLPAWRKYMRELYK